MADTNQSVWHRLPTFPRPPGPTDPPLFTKVTNIGAQTTHPPMLTLVEIITVKLSLTEDVTSTLTRLAGLMKKSTKTGLWDFWIEGFNKPIQVRDIDGWEEALQAEFDVRKEDSLARYVYVWTLVPQLPSAPYLPIFIWNKHLEFFYAQTFGIFDCA